MILSRSIENVVENRLLHKNKAIIVYGARQVGKTTVAKIIIENLKLKTLKINADIPEFADLFAEKDFARISSLASNYELIFIDEAQELPNIGKVLKIIQDEFPNLKLLVTGSSSFDLANKLTEPLTGRKTEFILFPFSFEEIKTENLIENDRIIKEMLIFGSYPEVFLEKNYSEKQEIILEISRSYLFKDLMALTTIKYPHKLIQLTKLLAFQIGNIVSTHELCKTLSLNRETVERYLNLLEKAFVIFRLSPFESNLRKTIKKQDKFFFYDLGLRNALIEDFKPISSRIDVGGLWENFIILERRKLLSNQRRLFSQYFWRTYDGAEIDLVEKIDGDLFTFEIKFNKTIKNPPKSWQAIYPESNFITINFKNYTNWLALKKE